MSDMTSGTNNKFVTRFIALVFMGLAFAGCAVILSNGERSQQYFRWRSVYATLDPAEYPETVGASAHMYRGTADERFVHALEALLDGIVPSS